MTALFIFLFLIANAHSAVGIPVESSNAQNTSFWLYCWSDNVCDYTKMIRADSLEEAEGYLEDYNRTGHEDCYIREEE